MGWGQERRGNRIWICDHRPLLAKDVQVDGGGFPQSMEDLVDLLDVQPLLWFPLPTPQHDIIHLFGADSGPLQNTALGDALDDLEKGKEQGSHGQCSAVAQRLKLSKRPQFQWCSSVKTGLRSELLVCPGHEFQVPGPSIGWSRPLLPFALHLCFFKLEDNCFTMLCFFLPYNNVNQSYIHTHTHTHTHTQGLQPTKFPRPWNSPGKNTGVGCHSLLQGIFPT